MIALTTPYLWYTTRATGMVALVLFTLVVSLGTLVANRVGGTVVGRFEVNELHRSVSIVAVVFLAIHILTTVLDSYAPTGWLSAIVPLTSDYRRIGVAVGAAAFDLILAVWISSLLKVRVKNETWRFIHWFSWLAFSSAVLHAYLTGTDAKSGAGLAVVAACALCVFGAALWRYVARPTRAAGRTALSPIASAKGPAPTTPRPVSPLASSSFPRHEPQTMTSTASGENPHAFPRSAAPRQSKRRR
ncbi:MAG TPA: ferric reductase-like transmembrane domain-containing protein [Acidimicrobiales bacterium]|nr:ferric reductase-like transmembrane domain-containing protein [Acidimicrobiales bacterium]